MYLPKRVGQYLAPIALAGGLLLSGCATTGNNSNQRKYDDETAKYITTGKYGEKSPQDKKSNANQSNASRAGNFVGDLIFEGLLRLLIP